MSSSSSSKNNNTRKLMQNRTAFDNVARRKESRNRPRRVSHNRLVLVQDFKTGTVYEVVEDVEGGYLRETGSRSPIEGARINHREETEQKKRTHPGSTVADFFDRPTKKKTHPGICNVDLSSLDKLAEEEVQPFKPFNGRSDATLDDRTEEVVANLKISQGDHPKEEEDSKILSTATAYNLKHSEKRTLDDNEHQGEQQLQKRHQQMSPNIVPSMVFSSSTASCNNNATTAALASSTTKSTASARVEPKLDEISTLALVELQQKDKSDDVVSVLRSLHNSMAEKDVDDDDDDDNNKGEKKIRSLLLMGVPTTLILMMQKPEWHNNEDVLTWCCACLARFAYKTDAICCVLGNI